MQTSSGSVYRIDESIFFTMGIMAVICLLVLGFRYVNYESCQPINLSKSSTNYYTRSLISFKAETKSGKTFEWYFGDHTTKVYGGSSVTHAYERPGTYTVNIIVNGRCEEVINVEIIEAPLVTQSSQIPQIEGPDSVLINVPVTFLDMTPDAHSWQWQFDNSQIIESESKDATFTFTTQGDHQVFLKINGSRDRYTTKNIYVKDPRPVKENANASRPAKRSAGSMVLPPIKVHPDNLPLNPVEGPKDESPKEAVKVVRDVQPDEISSFLEGVVTGKKAASDFSEFLCGDINLPVKYNNQAMKFSAMCEQLRGIKKLGKISKPQVVVGKDKLTNCIKTMDVTIKRKNLFQRIVD